MNLFLSCEKFMQRRGRGSYYISLVLVRQLSLRRAQQLTAYEILI